MKRSSIVLVLGLPGAVLVGSFGFLIAAFAGDSVSNGVAMIGWLIWGAIGGACLGAVLGVAVGLVRRIRWVIPIIGGIVGAVPGFLEASGMHLTAGIASLFGLNVFGRQTELGGYTAAVCLIAGIVVGVYVCVVLTKQDHKASGVSKLQQPMAEPGNL